MDSVVATKRCQKCGECKPPDAFWKRSRGDGLQGRCKSCQRADQAARSKTERWKQTTAAWRARNPDKTYGDYRTSDRVRAYNLKWRKNNPEKWKEAQRKTRERQVAELSDMYVKRQISRGEFSMSLVPDGLISAKRAQMKLVRLLKEKTK
jgi:hypothetical protein